MAQTNCTYQQQRTVSVNRERIIDIATNLDLSKKDLRLLILLLTQLEGHRIPEKFPKNYKDPMNFKLIDIEALADTLSLSKKDIKNSLDHLWDEGYIEEGSNDTVTNGYRFTF